MNGDAKSPQHTVVHPMYVSYSSIPTSASATMLSNKHHQAQIANHLQQNNTLSHTTSSSYHHPDHHQQQTFTKSNNNNNNINSNSNTFLIHTNSSNGINNNSNINNNNSSSTFSKKGYHNSNFNNSFNSNNNNTSNFIQTPNSSRNNTLTRKLYSPRNNKIASTSNMLPLAIQQHHQQQLQQQQQQQQYYDDSTAKADQLYTQSNRRQFIDIGATYQQHVANTPGTPYNSTHATTTPSLSYASLQNSNLNLMSGMSGVGGSNFSLTTNSLNTNTFNNNNNNNNTGSGRFARINSKPRPPKSTSYSSFKSGATGTTSTLAGGNLNMGSGSNLYRPDIKYTQMSNERQRSRALNECVEDDNFSLHNFKGEEGGITYVPFQSPTPLTLFQQTSTSCSNNNNNNNNNNNINASYASIISPLTPNNNNTSINNNSTDIILFNNNVNNNNNNNINNNNNNNVMLHSSSFQPLNNNEILLENGAILYPARPQLDAKPPVFNVATRVLQQQNSLPFYATPPYQRPPVRPTNIPLPSIPDTSNFNTPLSPSEVTPPPPPAPRPHIFQPRSGNAPYPDLSPEVTEKYAMPTQYVPRSPVAARIARRQRQQQQQQQLQQQQPHNVNSSANFCDQIRDAPPGYVDTGFSIVRARSHDRLSSANSASLRSNSAQKSAAQTPKTAFGNVDAAPHVNRRSGRREGRARPRSYCNSMIGGEGVVRSNIAADRDLSSKNLK